jgi:hypothetical protein
MNRSNRMSLALVLIAAICVMSVGCAPGGTQLPPAAADAIQEAYPKATVRKVTAEDVDGIKLYQAELANAGQKMDVCVTANGTIFWVETPVAAKDLPKAVADAVAMAAPGAEIKNATKTEELADPKWPNAHAHRVIYYVEVAKDGKESDFFVTDDGRILNGL